jgi:salicylate hydroxylase
MTPSLEEAHTVDCMNGRANENAKQVVTVTPSPTHPTRSLQFLEKLNTSENSSSIPPLEAKVKLRIIVVGAGLGGLACAIALARRGHEVVVLEQAAELGEVKSMLLLPAIN